MTPEKTAIEAARAAASETEPQMTAANRTILTTRISLWARQGGVQTTVAHSGRFRTVLDNCCIALGWMSKGGPYDDRTWRQRLIAGNYYWRAAGRAAIAKATGGRP